MLAKLINVEGAGGVGKTTHARYLEERLQYVHKQNTQRVDWLQSTAVGRSVKDFFNSDDDSRYNVVSTSWLLMLSAARRQAMEEVIYPLVASGTHVIVESFHDSMHVYLGEVLGIKSIIQQLENCSDLSELRERADHTLFLSSQGNTLLPRRVAFSKDSYPELMEKISYGNRPEILTAWDKYIQCVQLDTVNDQATVHVLDANAPLEDSQLHLDAIADSISK